jgi:dTDP-glucose 4,6-dehydratase
MRVIVTGGAGFIGSALCRILIKQGAIVCCLDKLTYAGTLTSLSEITDYPNFSFVQGDICDGPMLERLFDSFMPEAVMHLAAESHVDRSISGAAEFVSTNVTGTFQLLEAARKFVAFLPEDKASSFRFLHVSTDEVFGSLGDTGAFNEQTPYDPRSPYSASKAASDHLARAWFHTYNLPVIVTNCSNNYGPYHFPEKLIPLVILNALEGKILPVYGDGNNVRDWLFVEDHARALIAAIQVGQPGETYCLGGRSEVSNLQVVEQICDILDAQQPLTNGSSRRNLIAFVTDRPGHDHRYAIDPTKARNVLNWEAETDFAAGLAKTITWYLDNKAWWEPIRSNAYSGERLGLVGHPKKDQAIAY